MTDSEDSEDPRATNLDLNRLEDLEIGGSVHGECGLWSVFRYEKEYLVLFKSGAMIDLPDLKSVISYLSSR